VTLPPCSLRPGAAVQTWHRESLLTASPLRCRHRPRPAKSYRLSQGWVLGMRVVRARAILFCASSALCGLQSRPALPALERLIHLCRHDRGAHGRLAGRFPTSPTAPADKIQAGHRGKPSAAAWSSCSWWGSPPSLAPSCLRCTLAYVPASHGPVKLRLLYALQGVPY